MATHAKPDYIVDEHIGFILRQVSQRHTALFAASVNNGVTVTQWSLIAKLLEIGPCSQNRLGRLVGMDAPTTKGVIDRLRARGLTATDEDPEDGRRLTITLTRAGRALAKRCIAHADAASSETLAPLTTEEQRLLLALLKRLI
jgi:DNA-binding MarR family transcriptional regulator